MPRMDGTFVKQEQGKKVLLYSGGLDSYCYAYLWKPNLKLYIDYKGIFCEYEKAVLPPDVLIKELDLSEYERPNSFIPYRNIIFIEIAAMYGNIIALGVQNDDTMRDKEESVRQWAEEGLSYLSSMSYHSPVEKDVSVVFPYAHLSKHDLFKEAVEAGMDLDKAWRETWSCADSKSLGKPCGVCGGCNKKRELFAEFGYKSK